MTYRRLASHPLHALLSLGFARAAAGALGAATPLLALANPTGGQVVAGTATISHPSRNGTLIDQSSQRAVINWQQFNLGANQYVQFLQSDSSAVVLNRIVGGNASEIFGNIRANGQVFLVNPNGLYFAPSASIDVGGLVASTLGIKDADFMAGHYQFSKVAGAPDAGVDNQGRIQTSRGGYVVLAGDYAQNEGRIDAQFGRVYLAAGNAATLTLDSQQLISYSVDGATLSRLAGVSNSGEIAALGGAVVMTADVANTLTASAVNNSGVIAAHSVRDHGGVIVLAAEGGDIYNSGALDASAVLNGTDGGAVIVHANGGNTTLAATSKIDTAGQGEGQGGFLDVSGHELTLKGFFDVGKGGKFLLDPSIIRIEAAAGSSSRCSGCEGGVIHTNFIQHELNAGIDLTIIAGGSPSGGSIKNSGATAITATTGSGKLSLKIGRTAVNSASGSLHHITGSIFNNPGPGVAETFTPDPHGTINLTGITINIKGGFVASADQGTVTLGDVTANTVTISGNTINVGNLKATGAASTTGIFITAKNPAANTGITTGNLITTGGGAVNLSASGSNGANIVAGSVNAKGDLVVTAHAARTSGGGRGGNITINAAVTAAKITLNASGTSGGGSIKTKSLHANGTGFSQNVRLTAFDGAGALGSGNIKVTGTIAADHGGVFMHATGGGDSSGGGVTVTGTVTAADTVSVTTNYDGTSLQDGGGEVHLGNVVAGRGVNITVNTSRPVIVTGNLTAGSGVSGVQIHAINSHSGSSNISTGKITSSKSVTVTTTGSAKGDTVTIAGITANTSPCQISDCNAGDISIGAAHGDVKITGAIVLTHDAFVAGRVDLSGRTVAFGDITAPGDTVNIGASTISSINHAGITQTAGTTLKARDISVDLNASYGGAINLSNLVASSSKGPAGIAVTAQSHNAGNSIVVGGSITVKGKGGNPQSSFSSAMPGLGVPVGAFLSLHATGSAAGPYTVKVNGNIDVNAVGGAFNVNHPHCSVSCGTHTGPGFHEVGSKGGGVVVDVQASGKQGSAELLGTTTLKGTDAELNVVAAAIKTGALAVTGSGHISNLTVSSGTHHGASKNSVGRADVSLQGSSGDAATVTTGNITVSGKGSAAVGILATHVTAGNIAVTATAAKGSRSGNMLGLGLGSSMPGLFGLPLNNGGYSAGRAGVLIGASHGGPSHRTAPIQSLNVGNITVSGVGEADIDLAAVSLVTKSLSATATKGSMHGSGTTGSFVHKYTIKDGEAHIQLDTGSGNSGVVNVGGAIAASGPTAGVDIRGKTIKVSGGASALGSGGSVVSDAKNTKGSVHTHFTGPGPTTGVNIGGINSTASVNIGGAVKVQGPGLVSVLVTGHKVTLGGLSASASAARKYTVLDTSKSPTTDSFTLADAVVLVFQGSNSAVTGPATVTGDVNLNAPHGNLFLPTELRVGGQVTASAGVNIGVDATKIAPRFSEINSVVGINSGGGSSFVPSPAQLPFKVTAAAVSMTAGGNVGLSGAFITTTGVTSLSGKGVSLNGTTLTVGGLSAIAGATIDLTLASVKSVGGVVALKAGGNIVLSGVTLDVGTLVAYASGTIHNGGGIGNITANAVAFHAGKNLTLSSTDISVGSGTVPQDSTTVKGNAALKAALADTAFAATLSGDPQLLAGFALGGIPFTSPAPNATFAAGGAVSLGGLTMAGGYLYLQGASITLGSAVTAPKGLVVQVAPATPAGTTDVEGQGATGANLNLNNTGFIDQFGDGTTLVLGASGQTGDISLGNNGTFDIGADNLIVDTGGNVTGLNNVISTGIVSSLESLLGNALPPPTSGEIDPTSSNNNNTAGDKKHQGEGGGDVGTNGTQGGSITQDTSGGGACH